MKRVLPNNKIVNRDLKEKQINKNSNIDIEYNIKKIKKERRYTLILVIFFIVFFLAIFYFVFSKVQDRVQSNRYISGNLYINFESDLNGIKDSINIRNNKNDNFYYFTIFNNSNKKTKYIIYLIDEKDLINLEGCSNNIIDYNKLLFSINSSSKKSLMSVKDEDKYILLEDSITKKTAMEFRLRLYYDKSIKKNYHYHGRIIVEETKDE